MTHFRVEAAVICICNPYLVKVLLNNCCNFAAVGLFENQSISVDGKSSQTPCV